MTQSMQEEEEEEEEERNTTSYVSEEFDDVRFKSKQLA